MRAATLLAVFGLLLLSGQSRSSVVGAQAACDRACLDGIMTQYLNALAANNPKLAPLADSVRFTEDTVAMAVGEGFWKEAATLQPYRTDFLDVRESTAAVHALFADKKGLPVLFAARLKVADRRITEIETMVVRNAQEAMLFAPDNLKEKSAAMTLMPEKAQLMPRAQMIEIAQRYPEGLRIGSFAKADVPFAPGAYRLENGVRMAGPGCTFQPPGCVDMRNQRIPTLAGMKGTVVAVDEEAGLVLMRLDFGPGSLMGPQGAGKVLVTFEGFKIYGGQMHAVEAVFESMPQNAPTGRE